MAENATNEILELAIVSLENCYAYGNELVNAPGTRQHRWGGEVRADLATALQYAQMAKRKLAGDRD